MSFLKSIWKNNSKHKKLSDVTDELAPKNEKDIETKPTETKPAEAKPAVEATENETDAVTFKLKYLGSTAVEKVSPDAVKNVIKVAKAAGKKLRRVNVTISLKGINVTDSKGNDMFEVSIYKISNCSTDKAHRQVFSFISIDPDKAMECHAFWCSKKKLAEMVALTVAHAFSTAYESWRLSPDVGEFAKTGDSVESVDMKNTLDTMQHDLMDLKNDDEKLIDFETDVGINISYITGDSFDLAKNQWVCFEDDFASSFHDDFQTDFDNDPFLKPTQNNQNNIDLFF